MPGLIDPHVHLFLSGAPWWVGDTLAANLRATLAAGITTVVDVGGPEASFALRDRLRAGEILGPDLLALGPMVTALGSHPCESLYDLALCSFVSGEASGHAIGVQRTARGADGIKIALADADFTPWPTPRLDVAAVAAAVAAAPGLAVAHTNTPRDVREALDAGVDHLAHPPFGGQPSPDLAARIAEVAATHTTLGAFAGTEGVLDGTLDPQTAADPAVAEAWRWVAEHPGSVDPAWREASAAWLAGAVASLHVLQEAEATLLPASDAGYLYVPHGAGLHLELQRLSALGFSAEALLASATAGAADALGLPDRGRVAVGKRADLLVLDADPRADLSSLARPSQVIQRGIVHEPDALRGADVLLTPASSGLGQTCLDDRDCVQGRCDRIAHVCNTACDRTGQLVDPCGPGAWCAPAEGTHGPPVCRDVRTCDLYDVGSCAPEPYRERCVPLDLDTNGCFPAGEQREGDACDPLGIEATCAPGLFCPLAEERCRVLCDPQGPDPCRTPFRCRSQGPMDPPWFGLCE